VERRVRLFAVQKGPPSGKQLGHFSLQPPPDPVGSVPSLPFATLTGVFRLPPAYVITFGGGNKSTENQILWAAWHEDQIPILWTCYPLSKEVLIMRRNNEWQLRFTVRALRRRINIARRSSCAMRSIA
jgi:hypothetical protein